MNSEEPLEKFCKDLEAAALDFDRSNPWEATGAMLKKAAKYIRILERILGPSGTPPASAPPTPPEGTGPA